MIITLPDYLRGQGWIDYGQLRYRPVPHAMPGEPRQYGVTEPPEMARLLAADMFRFHYRARRVVVQASYSIAGEGYQEFGEGSFTAFRRDSGFFYPQEGEPPRVRDTTATFGGFVGGDAGSGVQIRGEISRTVLIDGEEAEGDQVAPVTVSGFFKPEEKLNDTVFFFQDGRYALPYLQISVGGAGGRVRGTFLGNRFETPPGVEQPGVTYAATCSVDFATNDPQDDLVF